MENETVKDEKNKEVNEQSKKKRFFVFGDPVAVIEW